MSLSDVGPTSVARDRFEETQRMRQAAHRARRELPEGVGELVARELLAWSEFGWTHAPDSPVSRAVDTLLRGWKS